jgi:hypothetical protein
VFVVFLTVPGAAPATASTPSAQTRTAHYLESIRTKPAKLRAFLKATDDPGVERVDLTHEYQLATTRYRLDYRALKTLSRASLEHAFLPGASLWRSPDDYRPERACAADRPGERHPSRPCRARLRHSTKALTQWKLEHAFRAFERGRRRLTPAIPDRAVSRPDTRPRTG